jgi:two-component system, OmpR family, sensor histidine kinase CpxA
MFSRFPLLAKIIGWFFVNLLVLGVAGWLLLRERFAFSMLATRTAGDRVAEVAYEIVAELPATRSEWNAVLAKYSQRYRVDFLLHANDGMPLAGPTGPLPPEVHSRLVGAMAPRGRPPREDGRPPPRNDGRPPRDDGRPFRDDDRPPREDGRPPPPPFRDDRRPPPPDNSPAVARELPDKILVQSSKPERYWVFKRVTVRINGVNQGAALLAVSDSPTGHGLYFDATPLLWAAAGVLVLSALVWFPLVRGITGSIAKMRNAAGRLAEGEFDARVETKRRDELGELGSEINRMAGRLAGYVDGQRRFLGDVAHELCAPVARLQMAVGILEQNAVGIAEQERLADVRDEVEHMAGLVNELLQFTRAAIGGKKIDLQDTVLKSVAEKAVRRETSDTSQVRVEIDDQVAVRAAPDLLQRALSNLVRNGIRYAGHAGPITVSAVRDGGEVFVSVTDQGPGVPAEALPKLFDPFFRVDTARTPGVPGGGGTGLGLAIVKTCVEACGGGVSARNVAPAGFEVTLRLPAVVAA